MQTYLTRPHKRYVRKALGFAIRVIIDQPLPIVCAAVINECVVN